MPVGTEEFLSGMVVPFSVDPFAGDTVLWFSDWFIIMNPTIIRRITTPVIKLRLFRFIVLPHDNFFWDVP
jgi:hypothetical protein